MDQETSRVVKKFVKVLRKKFNISRIILFGSRARGDNLRMSDYDFIVISNDFAKINPIYRMCELENYWEALQDLEALCYTPEEFEERKGSSILRKALKEGIDL